jgi:hypothetical protein
MAVLPTPGSPIRTGLFFVRPGEDLDDAADLVVAADDRVELASPRPGEVAAELLERLVGVFGALTRDAVRPRHLVDRLAQAVAGGAGTRQRLAGLSSLSLKGAEQVLRRDVLRPRALTSSCSRGAQHLHELGRRCRLGEVARGHGG